MTLAQMVICLWDLPGGATSRGTATRGEDRDAAKRGHPDVVITRYEGVPRYLACRGPVSSSNVYTRRGM